jgi:hypothetical protein
MKQTPFTTSAGLLGIAALLTLTPIYGSTPSAADARSIVIFTKPDTPGVANNKPLGARASIAAGYVYSFYAHVFDSLKTWKPALDKFITWALVDTIGNPPPTVARDCSTAFAPTRAFGAAVLTASFSDSLAKPIASVANLWITAGAAHHIVVEADSSCLITRSDNPIGAILLNDNNPSQTMYAVVRDRFGNFARFSNYASWQVSSPVCASVFPAQGKNQQAMVIKANPGQTEVFASEPGILPGSVHISVEGNVPPVPANAIQVAVTLLDTNKEGHLDRIDISWPDSIKVRVDIPTVSQLVAKMGIVTLASQFVELHPVALQRTKGNTLQVTLDENKDPIFETAWDSLKTMREMVLKYTPMTTDGRPFFIGRVVDAADPVVASVCLSPSPQIDSLSVEFSEPVNRASASFVPASAFQILQNGQNLTIDKLAPLKTIQSPSGICTYLLPHKKLNPLTDNLLVRASQIIPLAYCAGVSLVTAARACDNPFTPGKSAIPESQRSASDPRFGAKIQVQLISLTRLVSATLIIFDAVGNAVTNKIVMKKDYIGKSLYWIWDGKNRWGAVVGLGTYLGRVTLEEGDGTSSAMHSESVRILIGVKGN